jgi:hypothetical protein
MWTRNCTDSLCANRHASLGSAPAERTVISRAPSAVVACAISTWASTLVLVTSSTAPRPSSLAASVAARSSSRSCTTSGAMVTGGIHAAIGGNPTGHRKAHRVAARVQLSMIA